MTMTMTMTEEVFAVSLRTYLEGSSVVVVSSVALIDFGEPTQSAVAFVASFVASFVAVAVAAVASFVASFVAGVAMLEQEPVPSLQVLLFLVMPLQEPVQYRLPSRLAAVAAVVAVVAVVAILLQERLLYRRGLDASV